MSRRMGRFKPLLPFGGTPMLTRVVESLGAAGGIDLSFVVTGYQAQCVRDAVSRGTGFQPVQTASTGYKPVPRVAFIHNPNYEHGEMLSSVQAGVRALPDEVAAFILALGDQPAVRPETIQSLLAAWRAARAPLILPKYLERRGHPILISSECIADILKLRSDQTLKTLIDRRAIDIVEVPVDDPAIVSDVDTPEDYEQAVRLWDARPGAMTIEGGAYAR